MTKQGKPKTGGPAVQRGRFGKPAKTGGFKASAFARMRAGSDLVAFASPATPGVVRVYVEALEAFQQQKRDPRNFILIMTRNPDSDEFEAYQVSYEKVARLLAKAQRVEEERAYWKLSFRGRALSVPGGTKVDLRKIEKRD